MRIVSAWLAEHEPPQLGLDPAPSAAALGAFARRVADGARSRPPGEALEKRHARGAADRLHA